MKTSTHIASFGTALTVLVSAGPGCGTSKTHTAATGECKPDCVPASAKAASTREPAIPLPPPRPNTSRTGLTPKREASVDNGREVAAQVLDGWPGGAVVDVAANIERLGDHEVAVDRGLLNRVAADPMGYVGNVRVLPASADGKNIGIKVQSVLPNSLVGRLGFTSGDLILSVNQRPLTSVDAAMVAYAALSLANKLEFEVERSGRPTTLVVQIKD